MKYCPFLLINILIIAGCVQTPTNSVTPKPTYTITYSGNGNTDGIVPIDTNYYERGASVTIPGNTGHLSKTGYIFAAWNTAANGNGASYAPNSTFIMGAASVTLYVQWAVNTFTVTYNGNSSTSGTVPLDGNRYQPGAVVLVSGNPGGLVKTGYTFVGWNTATSGSGMDYSEMETFTMGKSDVMLYAMWTVAIPHIDSVMDLDGNVYHAIQIGTQIWTAENLRTTKYNDTTVIPYITDNYVWSHLLNSPAYCFYNNSTDSNEIKKWGALYNWYAVATGKLAPIGWHVPTDSEWTILENYLVSNGYNWDKTTTGNKIGKSLAATTGWNLCESTGAIGNHMARNNRTGFSALPGGARFNVSSLLFSYRGSYGYWWSATEGSIDSWAWHRSLSYNLNCLDPRNNSYKQCGYSVRLIRN